MIHFSSHNAMAGDLPLPSLSISGFRGFQHLSIPRLGRVTLLTGRNGAGKTTVLDAMRIYAAATHDSPSPLVALLAEKLAQQDEWGYGFDEDGDKVPVVDYSGLFHGRSVRPGQPVSIGLEGGENKVELEMYQEGNLGEEEEKRLMLSLSQMEGTDDPPLLVSVQQGTKYFLPQVILHQSDRRRYFRLLNRRRHPSRVTGDDHQSTEKLTCEFIGPSLPNNNSLVEFIDQVALTEDGDLPINALKLILGHDVHRIAVVGSSETRSRPRVMVKLSEQEPRIPLKSLGDGVTRFFGIAGALVKSRNGLLLIDEVENGIHYSIHEKLWTMILEAAHQYNIQVVAATHSWDAVRGFADAMENLGMEETCVVVRIDQHDGDAQAVKYTGEGIKTISEYDIEVR